VKRIQPDLVAFGGKLYITAPTGVAAQNIGGMTTWMYLGISPDSCQKTLSTLKLEASFQRRVKTRLTETQVLIIDEISMMENFHLDILNERMKSARNNSQPFGGVQVIVTGDFFQLAPIQPFTNCLHCGAHTVKLDSKQRYCQQCQKAWSDGQKWAFESQAWREANFKCINLSQIHRQGGDPAFVRILEQVRRGIRPNNVDIDLLYNHPCDVDNAPELMALVAEVEEVNRRKLAALKSETMRYWSVDKCRQHVQCTDNKEAYLKTLQNHRYQESLELRVGACVMLLANIDVEGGLYNGCQGTLVAYEVFHGTENELLANCYDEAQRTDIRAFVQKNGGSQALFPVVEFHRLGRKIQILPHFSASTVGHLGTYSSFLSRTQIPLALSWAMTIHKSQSMTMDHLICNPANCWESGQLYVALSRARNFGGLKVDCTRDQLEQALRQACDPYVSQFMNETFPSA